MTHYDLFNRYQIHHLLFFNSIKSRKDYRAKESGQADEWEVFDKVLVLHHILYSMNSPSSCLVLMLHRALPFGIASCYLFIEHTIFMFGIGASQSNYMH